MCVKFLFEVNPQVDYLSSCDVQTVLINGEVLMSDRVLTQLDEKKVLAEAKMANRDLMERVHLLSI